MTDLHFLRPEWFLLFVPIGLIWWRARFSGRDDSEGDFGFAPHLADALTVNRTSQAKFLPVDSVLVILVLCTFAAAGPSFRQLQSPWFSETAPLVVALEVSDSMRANDLLPSRLDRARFELSDLIQARTGARTALIAYSGTAHIVMPPTADANVIKPFMESLDPAIMPVAGANLSNVLPLARQLLEGETQAGTLLIVADGIDPADVAALKAFGESPDAVQVVMLLTATGDEGVALMPDGSIATNPDGTRVETRMDVVAVTQAASAAGVSLVTLSPDDDDIKALVREISSKLEAAADPDAVWVDDAWWLLWPGTSDAALVPAWMDDDMGLAKQLLSVSALTVLVLGWFSYDTRCAERLADTGPAGYASLQSQEFP